MNSRDANFQQQVFASSLGPLVPTLYWEMFDPDHVPGEYMDDNDVYQPTTVEDFEAMLDAWEEENKRAASGQNPLSFAESLGFGSQYNPEQ